MNNVDLDPRNARLLNLTTFLLGAFLFVGLALFYWSVVQAPRLLARDDNPRLFEVDLRIQRGTIVDRNGVIFAQSSGPANDLSRNYPVPAGGHAIGYYSFKYGASGIEEWADATLRGTSDDPWQDFWRQQRHLPQIGADIELTLDANLQATAVNQLNGRSGAILVLEKPHCVSDDTNCATQIRVMASQPSYDANDIDTQFDALGLDENAPLLNRAAQGQYQPGLLLQPFILATAVDQNLIRLSDPVTDPNRPILIGETLIRCTTPPPTDATWADVLKHQCPGPMQDLADQLGAGGLEPIFNAFGLSTDPILPIRTETTPDDPLNNPLMAGIGQDNLSVTPLQIGLALSSFVGNGRIYPPQLVNGQLSNVNSQSDIKEPVIGLNQQQDLLAALTELDGIREHNVQVLSGPGGSMDSWYVGLIEGETADTVIIVVEEANPTGEEIVEIGRKMGMAVKKTITN